MSSRLRLPHIKRDSILFVSGLIGVGHQTLIAKAEKPTLLILFGAMIGLPAFLRVDEVRSPKEKAPEKEPDGESKS